MKKIRFLFFLCILFFIAFFLANGSTISPGQAFQTIHRYLPVSHIDTSENTTDGLQAAPTLERLKRVLFLRQAIDRKLNHEHYVTIDKIPQSLQQAVIAVEDNRFYSHHGFDPEGIARAALVNLQYSEIEEGASTITQQLVKNLFLSHERSFGRKAEEFILALDVEAHYSKDEILELYLNTIYFGSNYYGIGPASEGYFAKPPAKLELPETAMLAGLPNAPSLYSPYVDFIMAKKRQFVVLDAMVRTGYITKDIAEDAKIKPVYLAH